MGVPTLPSLVRTRSTNSQAVRVESSSLLPWGARVDVGARSAVFRGCSDVHVALLYCARMRAPLPSLIECLIQASCLVPWISSRLSMTSLAAIQPSFSGFVCLRNLTTDLLASSSWISQRQGEISSLGDPPDSGRASFLYTRPSEPPSLGGPAACFLQGGDGSLRLLLGDGGVPERLGLDEARARGVDGLRSVAGLRRGLRLGWDLVRGDLLLRDALGDGRLGLRARCPERLERRLSTDKLVGV